MYLMASVVLRALQAGEGIVRLKPTWVPRTFTTPGSRLKLAREDLYAFGAHRGGICERWIASTTKADNGPQTSDDEGLSHIWFEGQETLLLDAIADVGSSLLGSPALEQHKGWNVLCKLFDNTGSLPHHVHHDAAKAALVGRQAKPESYYFPPQFNAVEHSFPYTFFGIEPGVTKGRVKDCLARWNDGDNGILELTKAYRIRAGTGWQIDPGILHGPGSLVTYEPQKNSDVLSMFQSMVGDQLIPWELVVKDVPYEFQNDLDYIVDLLDWEANVDPDFMKHNRRDPLPVAAVDARDGGYSERWVSYGSSEFSAKETVVLPGRDCIVHDAAAYGALVIQGHGTLGVHGAEAASLVRFGSMTRDEFFVSHRAATSGVRIANRSESEPLVILRHFGPGNAERPIMPAHR
jgi:hypothetical protein